MRPRQIAWLLTIFVVNLCLCRGFGQSNFATLTGTVNDSSGAVVARAVIEAVNQANNYRYTGQSDEAGNYTIPNLLEGAYRVKVTAAGFQEFVVETVQLRAARRSASISSCRSGR